MKKYSISTIGYTLSYALLIFCLLFSDQVSAQTCITWEADMKNPWPVLWFTGRAEDYVRVKKVGDGDNAWYWLDNDFSIDIWVYNTLPWTMLANTYSTVWKAGYIDDIRRNMHLVFIRGTTGDLYIRVSDGVGIGNTDIVYQIKETDYLNNFYKKWVHLTVTWEKWNNPVYKDGGTVRLFINGVKPGAGEQDWDYFYNIGVSTTLVIGSTGQPGKGFRGLLSGYRLWEEITLSKTEIKYIKDRSFCDTSSFNSTYAYLYDHLTVNMITMEDSVTSLNGGSPDARAHRVELEETPDLFRGVGYKIFHPTGPFPPGDITDQRECSSIRLDWSDYTEEATGYPGSHEIWRKYGTDSLLLCTTNDKYYIDSAGLVPGREYTYLIRSKWFQPVDFLFYNPSLYRFALEIPGVTTSVKTLPYPETISISEDASTGKCDGSVMIEWAEVNGASSYDVYYQVNNGDTLYLGESTNTTYSHAVSPEELGDTLRYFVEAKGDGDCYLLSPRSGIASANTKCNTKPVNQVATVEGDNIMLTWDFTQSGAPATEFKILRDPGTGIYETIAPSISILDREFTDYDAVMCNGYKYKIMARNACGDSEDATSLATTEVTIPQQFDNVFDHTPAYFDASKGYYNTKVVLVWAVNPDKKGDIETFEIYRKNIDLSSYTLIATIDNKNATYWEDKAVDANTMFMYMIRATGKCDALQVISDSLTAIGFRTNTGIISGKVTYEGGNAVEGVEVRVKSEGVTRAKSINFDGIDVKMISEKSLLEMGSLHTGALSVDCWIRPGKMSPTERHYIFTSDSNSLFICLKNMRPFAGVDIEGGPTVSIDADTVLNDSTWYHLVLNFDPAGSMDIYLDGNRINSADFTPVAAWSSGDEHIMIGGRYFTFFTGQIDEVRIWNRFRTAEEIKRDYTRLLAGNETGLVAYWRFNEGVGSFAYDISRAGDLFCKARMIV